MPITTFSSKPRLILTSGEPAGIGPDICLGLAQHTNIDAELIIICDIELLKKRAKKLKLEISFNLVNSIQDKCLHKKNTLNVLHEPLNANVIDGKLNADNANYVLNMLKKACDLCLNGQVDAMVTAPLQKSVINDAGINFTGHTEFLAEQCNNTKPLMLLACPEVKIALATTHLPLAKVADNINFKSLEEILRILNKDLQERFNLNSPHITVCGLNPHAGEDGHLGREEIDVISPVLKKLRAERMNLIGPVSADTAFTEDKRKHTDAYLCMYHDQGLPVLKTLGFGNAVNITLGLPIIRTSVDHGTALELAGTGQADFSSLFQAIKSAITIVNNTKQFLVDA